MLIPANDLDSVQQEKKLVFNSSIRRKPKKKDFDFDKPPGKSQSNYFDDDFINLFQEEAFIFNKQFWFEVFDYFSTYLQQKTNSDLKIYITRISSTLKKKTLLKRKRTRNRKTKRFKSEFDKVLLETHNQLIEMIMNIQFYVLKHDIDLIFETAQSLITYHQNKIKHQKLKCERLNYHIIEKVVRQWDYLNNEIGISYDNIFNYGIDKNKQAKLLKVLRLSIGYIGKDSDFDFTNLILLNRSSSRDIKKVILSYCLNNLDIQHEHYKSIRWFYWMKIADLEILKSKDFYYLSEFVLHTLCSIYIKQIK